MYWPSKYYTGLSKEQATRRKKDVRRRISLSSSDPAVYRPFATDRGIQTRRSKYTKRFPPNTSLKEYSQMSGVPLSLIRKSYNRGMAAWRTGHRPGATQQQWGYARVASMLSCGKTHYTTDADLVKKAKKSQKVRTWFRKSCRR